MSKQRPYHAREAGRLQCPDCGGRNDTPCDFCKDRRVVVLYWCPHCDGKTPRAGKPNACEVCLGNRTVNLEILDVYQREGLEGYRRWMQEILSGIPGHEAPDNQD